MRCYPPSSSFSWSLDIHEIFQAVATNVPQITLCVRNYDKFQVKSGKLEGHLPHDLDRGLAVALCARTGIRTNCVRRRRQSPVRGSRRRQLHETSRIFGLRRLDKGFEKKFCGRAAKNGWIENQAVGVVT